MPHNVLLDSKPHGQERGGGIIGRVGARTRLKQSSTVVTVFFFACGIVFAVLDPAPVRANEIYAGIRGTITSGPSPEGYSSPDFVCFDAPGHGAVTDVNQGARPRNSTSEQCASEQTGEPQGSPIFGVPSRVESLEGQHHG